jgi:hypothetical protein
VPAKGGYRLREWNRLGGVAGWGQGIGNRSNDRAGGATPGAPFFVDLVNGESIAIGLMLDFAAALGRSEADLQAYEPRPRGQTYPSYAAWLGFYGSDVDIAAAYLVNFPMFGENSRRRAPRYATATASRPSRPPSWTSSPLCLPASSRPP